MNLIEKVPDSVLARISQCAVERCRTSVGESKQSHPGTSVTPGSSRSIGGGNKAGEASDVKGPVRGSASGQAAT